MRGRPHLSLSLIALLLPAPALLEGQNRPPAASIRPAPEAGAGRGAAGRGFGRGGFGRGGWFMWPWGWWSQREERPLPPPHTPETPARAWVENKDYASPRMAPAWSEFAEGALPAPPVAATAPARLAPCRLTLGSGAVIDAAWCEWRDDSVRYADVHGRLTRLSRDQIDLPRSTRPE